MSPVENHENGRTSSLLVRIPLHLREKLDQAICDRQPSSLAKCYEVFSLASHDVSLPAFYRYARRVRERFLLDEASSRFQRDDPDAAALLPQVIARRLLTIVMTDDEATPESLHRLTLAYRAVHIVNRDIRRDAKQQSAEEDASDDVRFHAMRYARERIDRLEAERREINNAMIARGINPYSLRPLEETTQESHVLAGDSRQTRGAGIEVANSKPDPAELSQTLLADGSELNAEERTQIDASADLQFICDRLAKWEGRKTNRSTS